jgi:hypothetical protein
VGGREREGGGGLETERLEGTMADRRREEQKQRKAERCSHRNPRTQTRRWEADRAETTEQQRRE